MPGRSQGAAYVGIERAQTFGSLHDTALQGTARAYPLERLARDSRGVT